MSGTPTSLESGETHVSQIQRMTPTVRIPNQSSPGPLRISIFELSCFVVDAVDAVAVEAVVVDAVDAVDAVVVDAVAVDVVAVDVVVLLMLL
eukprot:gene1676-4801_t